MNMIEKLRNLDNKFVDKNIPYVTISAVNGYISPKFDQEAIAKKCEDVLNNEILKFSKDIEIILDKEVEDFLVDEIKKCYKIKIKSIGRNISEKIYKV